MLIGKKLNFLKFPDSRGFVQWQSYKLEIELMIHLKPITFRMINNI